MRSGWGGPGRLLWFVAWLTACAVDSRSAGTEPLTPFAGTGGTPGNTPSSDMVPGPSSAGSVAAMSSTSSVEPTGDASGVPTNGPQDGKALAADSGVPVESLPGSRTVTGHVIDFFRRPVPNVLVHIGDATTTTDGQGLFSIASVGAAYDAALLVNTVHFSHAARYGYLYQGLTRGDPTLQVYEALPERQTSLTVSIDNVDFSAGKRWVSFAFSSPDARFAGLLDSSSVTVGATGWTGPATTTGTAHALTVLVRWHG
jgi:hypothetical protein